MVDTNQNYVGQVKKVKDAQENQKRKNKGPKKHKQRQELQYQNKPTVR